MDAFHQKLLIEYFKEMRAEINLRIKNHTAFVTAKVATAGALLAFMLTENVEALPEVKSYGFLLVPIVAMLYDIMIGKNIQNIHRIGSFIRDSVENQVPSIDLWEKYAGQRGLKTRCYGLADIVFLSLFTVGTAAISVFILYKNEGVAAAIYVGIALALILACAIVYMRRAILFFEPAKSTVNSGADTSA